jgi:DNA-directed RNA polymerase subunit H (RpoH/RPB5)
MIVATVDFPDPDRTVLVVVIEKENLDRMLKADPITLESKQQGGKVMPIIRHPENLSILIAYEEDQPELYRIAQAGDLVRLLTYLERNRKWKPEVDGQVTHLARKGKS